MMRVLTMALLAIGFVMSFAVAAESGNMMGGAAGGSTMGSANSTTGVASMMGGGSMMGSNSGTRGLSSPFAVDRVSEGEVRKVDPEQGKLTLQHGPLANLDMPAMTMVFRVRDPAWLSQLKVGDKVRFVAERIDSNLTVTALETVRR